MAVLNLLPVLVDFLPQRFGLLQEFGDAALLVALKLLVAHGIQVGL